MKITGTNRDSKCSYCQSTSYGKTCNYGPQKTHMHVDDPLRCIWCGSTSIGNTCIYNPYGKYHQRGSAYNPMVFEASSSGIIKGLLMKRLAEPITEMAAFKLGLIDDHGVVIKTPETIEERNAFTSTDKYILKLRKLFERDIDILNTTMYFENEDKDDSVGIADFEKMYSIELDYKTEIFDVVDKLVDIVEKYNRKGLSTSKLEKILAENIIHSNEQRTDRSEI